MKKISVLFVIGLFFLVGCATDQGQPQIQIDPESQVIIAKIAGRRAGYELEKQYPEVSHEVLALSKAILIEKEPDIVRIVVDRLVVVLAAEIDDPLLAADLQDIVALIKIETGVEITDKHMRLIQAAAEGLISGIKIAKLHEV
jgi:hypothetical protein